MIVPCPVCGQEDKGWLAIEVYTSPTPVEFDLDGDELVLDISPEAEFIHELTTSITTGYKCGNEECVFSLTPIEARDFVQQYGRKT